MFPTIGNQSIDLNCKSIDWLLYDKNIGMKKITVSHLFNRWFPDVEGSTLRNSMPRLHGV